MIVLPTIDANSYTVQAALDDLAWTLRMDWNAEEAWWTLAVADAMQIYQLQGVVLVPNYAVLNRFHHLSIPTGEIMALAQEAQQPIGRDCFTDGIAQLVYMTAAEYATI